jgi:hypothetical protein
MNNRFLTHAMLGISLALLVFLASTVGSAGAVEERMIPGADGNASHPQPNLGQPSP